ncbi:MAG: DUF4258 domain-containing protein [Anaerolineales bacterium]|nr:DUF4258 domain-containing protein [Anaerolineales bacterium]
MREKVRNRQYVMALHAEEEMDGDNLSIFDIESGILTGNIRERQKDKETAEWKYVIEGQTLTGVNIAVVTKLSVTEKLVIITVWREQRYD